MIRNLKRKLYFLFVSSIMGIFTIVFFLLAHSNIETMQNAERIFMDREAANLIQDLEHSTDYVKLLGRNEQNFHYSFRLSTGLDELIYESTNRDDVAKITDLLEETLRSHILASPEDNSPLFHCSSQTGVITFRSPDGKTYYGTRCSIYTDTGYVYLTIVNELPAFLPTIIHYFLIWLIVLMAVLSVSILLIGQAVKPARQAMQSQKNFIAAVSHELKSPLAVILSAADAIEISQDCTGKTKSNIALISSEISRMTKLIQDLLLLSSIDAGNWTLHKSEINVDSLLINLFEKFENICRQKAIHLQIQMPEECFPPLIADEDRLSQIISILLDNAISYSPEQSVILLKSSIRKNELAISVIDHGIGISEEDKKHIFDRFYRCDKSRTKKEHYGLGLSIANELITLLAGKITLSDTPGGGCSFTIAIPWDAGG